MTSLFNTVCRWQARPLRNLSFPRILYQSFSVRDKVEWTSSIEEYIVRLVNKSNHLKKRLAESDENLSVAEMKDFAKEVRRLKPIVETFEALQTRRREIHDIRALSEEDNDLKELVEEEVSVFKEEIDEMESALIDRIIPEDEDDVNNAILEVRAGAGGSEAGIFASEMFSMYSKLSTKQKWKFELVSQSDNSSASQSVNKAVASIVGRNVFGMLKHEIGVHRVQRIPLTESQGRVHTSTIAVSVMSQPNDINSVVKMKDVKVDTFKSSGAGGQHVNTTDSAVRLTHIPTGIIVSCQNERSQFKNKDVAMRVLTAKIHEMERRKQITVQNEERRSQVGNLERSEKIRTYNFPQGRITDHRLKESIFDIEDFLSGGDSVIDLMHRLKSYEKVNALSSLT